MTKTPIESAKPGCPNPFASRTRWVIYHAPGNKTQLPIKPILIGAAENVVSPTVDRIRRAHDSNSSPTTRGMYHTHEEIRAGYRQGHEHGPSIALRLLAVRRHGEGVNLTRVRNDLARLSDGVIHAQHKEMLEVESDIASLLNEGYGCRLVPLGPKALAERLRIDRPFSRGGMHYYPADAAYTLGVKLMAKDPTITPASFADLFGYRGVKPALERHFEHLERRLNRSLEWPNVNQVATLKEIELPAEGVIVIKAPCGVGKTKDIGGPALAASGFGLHLSPRIALATSAAKRLRLTDYAQVKKSVVPHAGIAACVNSICHRMIESYLEQVDCLVVDEWHSVLNTLAAPEIQAMGVEVHAALGRLLKTVKQVIILDADISDSDLAHLEQFCGDRKFTVFELPESLEGYTFNIVSLENLVARLDTGDPSLLVTDSKKQLLGLAEEGFFDGGLIITADEPDQAFMQDPNKVAKGLDHIGLSPAADTGISLVTDRPVLASFHGVVTPSSMQQAVFRERTCREFFIYMGHRQPPVKVVRNLPDQMAIWQAITGRRLDYDAFVTLRQAEIADETRLGVAGFLRQMAMRGATLVGRPAYSVELEQLLSDLGKNRYARRVFDAHIIPQQIPDHILQEAIQDEGGYAAARYYAVQDLGQELESPEDVTWWDQNRSALSLHAYVQDWRTPAPDPDHEPAARRHFYPEKVRFFAWFLGAIGHEWTRETRDQVAREIRKHPDAKLLFTDSELSKTPATVVRVALNKIGLSSRKCGEGDAKFQRHDKIGVRRFEYHLDQHRRLRTAQVRQAFFGNAFQGRDAQYEGAFSALFTRDRESIDLWPEAEPWRRRRDAKRLWDRMHKRGCGLLGHLVTLTDEGIFITRSNFFSPR